MHFMSGFVVRDLGLTPYQDAWDEQRREHARVVSGGPPTLLLVEHPPVLTLGRSAHAGTNIVASQALLEANHVSVFEVERGGDVTYHGPGQLVGYLIFPVGRRVRDFLRLIEAGLVGALAEVGLAARANPGYAGVYVQERVVNGRTLDQKIASIGVAVKQNVALHGFGLNVSTNLDHFDFIVPCGLTDTQMTSVAREYQLRGLGPAPDVDHMKRVVSDVFAQTFIQYDWTLPGHLDQACVAQGVS
jgi:lipoyl(octanoyl) transferase